MFTIGKAPVTATAGSGTAAQDGVTHSPSACVVTGTYKGDLTCANSPASVGPAPGTTTIVPVVSGTGLANFSITPVNGSYTITPAMNLTDTGPADMWVGVKTSADVGAKFDFKAEVFKNGTLIGSGQLNGVTISQYSSTFNSSKAVLKAIGLSTSNLPTSLVAGDTLTLKVSVRIAATSTHASATARLWSNVATGGEGNSHVHTTQNGSTVRYYLIPGFLMTTSSAVSGSAVATDVTVTRTVKDIAGDWSAFGTWAITIH
jgi:hypothetical protein